MDSKATFLEIAFWSILIFGTLGTLDIILLFFPHQIIRVQGKFHRKWSKEVLNMSDEQIDRLPMLPTDRFFAGKQSDFIREAPENPKKFTRMITAYRIFGLILAIVLILYFFLWVIGVVIVVWTGGT